MPWRRARWRRPAGGRVPCPGPRDRRPGLPVGGPHLGGNRLDGLDDDPGLLHPQCAVGQCSGSPGVQVVLERSPQRGQTRRVGLGVTAASGPPLVRVPGTGRVTEPAAVRLRRRPAHLAGEAARRGRRRIEQPDHVGIRQRPERHLAQLAQHSVQALQHAAHQRRPTLLRARRMPRLVTLPLGWHGAHWSALSRPRWARRLLRTGPVTVRWIQPDDRLRVGPELARSKLCSMIPAVCDTRQRSCRRSLARWRWPGVRALAADGRTRRHQSCARRVFDASACPNPDRTLVPGQTPCDSPH